MAKQTEIAYEPTKEWQDFQTGGTRIDAVDLNNMEQGISDACAAVDELRTKRLPTYLVATGGDEATQDVYQEAILGPCLIVDLSTATTYYDNGEDGEGHERTKLTSGSDIDALRDSLSQTPSLTSYVTDLGGSHVTRIGTTCYIRLYLRVTQGFAANSNLTTLPEAYRPAEPAFVTASVTKDGETTVGHGDVMADGKVMIPATMASGDGILLWGAWAVEP